MTSPSEYTPPTDQVRRYWQYGVNAWRDGVARDDDTQADGTSAGAEFDRWLAETVRAAQEQAWNEGRQSALEDVSGYDWDIDLRDNPYTQQGD